MDDLEVQEQQLMLDSEDLHPPRMRDAKSILSHRKKLIKALAKNRKQWEKDQRRSARKYRGNGLTDHKWKEALGKQSKKDRRSL